MRIIDVSKWQGHSINWDRVKSAGIDGVLLRAGYGRYASQKDPTFEKNYSECKRVGLAVGAYWYSYATNVAQAAQEAHIFLDVLAGKQFELPVAYDIEYEPGILALTNAQRTRLVKTFLSMVEQAGYYVILYASTDFIKNKLNYKELTRYDVWAAQYGKKCTCPLPYGIWQYTSAGRVDGVAGNVDLNTGYKDYPHIIRGAGLNGFTKTPGQPAGDGSNAGETRPPDGETQPNGGEIVQHSSFTVGPVSPGDFAQLYAIVKAKADELGNIPIMIE